MRFPRLAGIAVLTLSLSIPSFAGLVVIDFEGVADSTSAAGLYVGSGVDFSSGIIAVSGQFGGVLNEVDFPPVAPGQAVFLNDADTTILTFSSPILSFSGMFTYGGPLSLEFYDAGNQLLTSLSSAFSTNIATGGDPGSAPNEVLDPGPLADAVRVEIHARLTDFALDNLTFETVNGTVIIPEPGTFLLATLGLFSVAGLARRKRR
jgi:hypothetical protein